jgi:carboxyl-terminal processing protease
VRRTQLLITCWLVSLGFTGAGAQQLDDFERRRIETMLERVRDAITSQYYDSTFHGVDLVAKYDTALGRIRASAEIDRAMAAVAQFALELRDSHTFFVPPQMTVTAQYGWDMAMVGDTCFVVSVEKGSDAEKQGVRAGDAVLAVNGSRPTRANLWQLLYLYRVLRPQRALRATLHPPGGSTWTLDLAARIHERKKIIDLTGSDGGDDIARLVWDAEKNAEADPPRIVEVSDSVLLWRFPSFVASGEDVTNVMRRAQRKQRLIIDLRGNSGGLVSTMTTLLGQLYSKQVDIGRQRERGKDAPLVAEGAGTDAFTGTLIVLVDSRSASASEVTARVVELTKRGRVLGDRTAGAVMRGHYNAFRSGTQTAIFYGVSVADADFIMADSSRLEGAGVVPDELILPTGADIAAGRDPVLARALALAGQSFTAEAAGALLRRRP